MNIAFQSNAFQNNAFAAGVGLPAFQNNAFQYDLLAFQMEANPVPPTPDYDGHDGGRKKALKKLRELEDQRIKFVRERDEHRKMLLTHAIDPQAKAEYEARMAKLSQQAKAPENQVAKEIDKIDRAMARVAKLKQNLEYTNYIRAELNKIHTERALVQHKIAMQIREKDDELALMMMM